MSASFGEFGNLLHTDIYGNAGLKLRHFLQ